MSIIKFLKPIDLSSLPDLPIPAASLPAGAEGRLIVDLSSILVNPALPSGLNLLLDLFDGQVRRVVVRDDSGPLIRVNDLPSGITGVPATALSVFFSETLGTDDSVTGAGRADTLYGFGGDDFLQGLRGDDRLFGGSGDDTLIGGRGNDLLEGGPGRDEITGGPDTDTVSYASSRKPVTVTLQETGLQDTGGAGFAVITGVENIKGGRAGDRLTGKEGRNLIEGGSGNDTLDGGGGNDLLRGGRGHDTGLTAPGKTTFDGGLGRDVIAYGGTEDATILLGRSGFQTVAADHQVRLRNVEGAMGGEGADLLIGNGRANTLIGGPGDTLRGRGGADTLIGGGDSLTGGRGPDTFVFGEGTSPTRSFSTVTDFRPGTDKIDLGDYVSRDGLNNPVAFRGFIKATESTLEFSDPSLELEDIGDPGVLVLTEFGPRDFRLTAEMDFGGGNRLDVRFTTNVDAMTLDDILPW